MALYSTVFLFSGRLGGGLADSECDFEWTFVVFFALDSFLLVRFFQVKLTVHAVIIVRFSLRRVHNYTAQSKAFARAN